MSGITPEQFALLISAFRSEVEDFIPAVLLQWYFNGSVDPYVPYTPYVDTEEAINVIGDNWYPYLPVNVAGVDYWYLPDGSLVNKVEYLTIADNSIALAKIVNMATASFIGRNTAGSGSPEVLSVATVLSMLGLDGIGDILSGLSVDIGNKVDKVSGSSLITSTLLAKIHDKFATDEVAVIQALVDRVETEENYTTVEKAKLGTLKQNVYSITFLSGNSVTERCAGSKTLGTGTDTWTLAPGTNPVDLKITHTLSRDIAHISVFSIDGTTKTLLDRPEAYMGINANTNEIVITGLATIATAITINLIFA